MSVEHATFVLERTYPVEPARVFEAFADPALKERWFSGPGWEWEMEFRVGGRERSSGEMDGRAIALEGRYYDIVGNQRIVFAYEMYMNGARISVSLATYEITPADGGARLVLTEQGAFLDGRDKPDVRQGGTEALLDELGAVLEAG